MRTVKKRAKRAKRYAPKRFRARLSGRASRWSRTCFVYDVSFIWLVFLFFLRAFERQNSDAFSLAFPIEDKYIKIILNGEHQELTREAPRGLRELPPVAARCAFPFVFFPFRVRSRVFFYLFREKTDPKCKTLLFPGDSTRNRTAREHRGEENVHAASDGERDGFGGIEIFRRRRERV